MDTLRQSKFLFEVNIATLKSHICVLTLLSEHTFQPAFIALAKQLTTEVIRYTFTIEEEFLNDVRERFGTSFDLATQLERTEQETKILQTFDGIRSSLNALQTRLCEA